MLLKKKEEKMEEFVRYYCVIYVIFNSIRYCSVYYCFHYYEFFQLCLYS